MDSDDKMPAYKIQVLVEEWSKYGKGTVIAGGTEHFVDEGVVGDGGGAAGGRGPEGAPGFCGA